VLNKSIFTHLLTCLLTTVVTGAPREHTLSRAYTHTHATHWLNSALYWAICVDDLQTQISHLLDITKCWWWFS